MLISRIPPSSAALSHPERAFHINALLCPVHAASGISTVSGESITGLE